MDQRGKKLVLLALSRGDHSLVEVQTLASNNITIEQHVQPLEQNNSISCNTNSENQAARVNPGETTETYTERDDTTLENNSSPSILANTNGSQEQDDINDSTTGDFSGTDSGNEYSPNRRARSVSSTSSSSSTSCSSSNSRSSSTSSDSSAENINPNNSNFIHEHNQSA